VISDTALELISKDVYIKLSTSADMRAVSERARSAVEEPMAELFV